MTVYAVQVPMKRDLETGKLVSKYDLTPALHFGEIVELLSPTAKPFNPDPLILELDEKLVAYDCKKDYIICIGNPILLSMAVCIAANFSGGEVQLLQWHGHKKRYVPVKVDMGFGSLD
jgi:hypothetical protein